ncbi:MAG: efflux RND transporter permease subunit, partial [Candidatus Lindowbacteria bacterium]|nr:efflux RND transporter permease subunit [Candidatus Lindowbacteria bacterium]
VERSRAVTSIKRVDGRRVINVTGDIIEGQVSAEKVIAELKATVIPQLRTDFPGLQTSMAGDSQDRDDSMRSLTAGFAVAMVLIYVLLAIPFGSYLQPLVVMVSIPFGIIGAILGHLFMGFVMRDPVSYGLSIMSMFGIVALSGVVVNDSLVLIYTANSNRKDGMPADEAVIQAAMRRFRPILLTSVTTFLGLAPMIFETSVQAKFLVPMALSLGYGILFSTGIILVLVPALYLAVEDIKNL